MKNNMNMEKIYEIIAIQCINMMHPMVRKMEVPTLETEKGNFSIKATRYGLTVRNETTGVVVFEYDYEHDYDNLSTEKILNKLADNIC